jgi:hypothetical protein
MWGSDGIDDKFETMITGVAESSNAEFENAAQLIGSIKSDLN